MKLESEFSAADIICLRLLVEEGIFIQRIMHQHKTYPDCSSVLALTVMPFLALIEHDALPYLKKKYRLGLPKENADLVRIRHKTKAIDPRYLSYQSYSENAMRIIEESRKSFRGSGFARFMPSSLVKDVGISYYDGLPIYSTFSVANILDDGKSSLWNSNSRKYCSAVGYNAGSVLAFHYCFADQIVKDKSAFKAAEFAVTANDYTYSSLFDYRMKKQTNDEYAFFFLAEQLLRLSSIEALRKAGFLENILWVKLSTVYLYHAHKSIESFRGFTYQPSQGRVYSVSFLKQCAEIFDRDEMKLIKRMRKLRNAFVHYDFENLVSGPFSDPGDFTVLLETVISSVIGMELSQYELFLFDSMGKTITRLKEITGFPEYNSKHNVFCH